MNLRDRNLRIALLRTLAKAVNDELALEREGHLSDLLDRYDEDGTTSFTVLLPGDSAGLGKIILNEGKASWDIDGAELLEWAKEHAPTMVRETVVPPQPEMRFQELWPASVAALEKRLDWVEVEGEYVAVDTATGQIVPGVTYKPAGRPSQFQVRLSAQGKERVIRAWASGQLNEIARGALPQIEAPPAEVVEAEAEKKPPRRRKGGASGR
jgi:hypothetical protein